VALDRSCVQDYAEFCSPLAIFVNQGHLHIATWPSVPSLVQGGSSAWLSGLLMRTELGEGVKSGTWHSQVLS
jgi:hypothetical protein